MDNDPPTFAPNDKLIGIAIGLPIFAVTAYFSSLEKALIAATISMAMWTAVSAHWSKPKDIGFWVIVAMFGVANSAAIWALPTLPQFKAGLTVAFPVGIAEGFLLYWLLGLWLRRKSA
jgi:hypothetical protein